MSKLNKYIVDPRVNSLFYKPNKLTFNWKNIKRQEGGDGGVIAEDKEWVKMEDGSVAKINNAPTHDDGVLITGNYQTKVGPGKGGVAIKGVESVISATQENRNVSDDSYTYKDEEIKIKPEKAINIANQFGFKIQKPSKNLSPAKLLDLLLQAKADFIAKYKQAENTETTTLEAKNSAKANQAIINALPSDEDLYDIIFSIQENSKEEESFMQIEEQDSMQSGGIPQRYINKGFTKVGVKKQAPEGSSKKWQVLAKKEDKYKIVSGGYRGMEDFTQHGDKDRQKNFWNRMGGKDSAKANDKFSPLYWHKKFGTWQTGGDIDNAQTGGSTFEDWYKTVPENKNDTTSYNLKRAYELAPKEELDAFVKNPKAHLRSVYENNEGIYEFLKSKNHPTINKELEWYNSKQGSDFKNKYNLDTSGEYYKYIPKYQVGGYDNAQTGVGSIKEDNRSGFKRWLDNKTIGFRNYDHDMSKAATEIYNNQFPTDTDKVNDRTFLKTTSSFLPIYETYLDLKDIAQGAYTGNKKQLNQGTIGLFQPFSGKAIANTLGYLSEKFVNKDFANKNEQGIEDVMNGVQGMNGEAFTKKLFIKYGYGGYDKWLKDGKPKLQTGGYDFAKTGINLDPAKKGTFKAQATRMGMSVQEAANEILNAPEGRYTPEMRKKANFAKNFAKQIGGEVEYAQDGKSQEYWNNFDPSVYDSGKFTKSNLIVNPRIQTIPINPNMRADAFFDWGNPDVLSKDIGMNNPDILRHENTHREDYLMVPGDRNINYQMIQRRMNTPPYKQEIYDTIGNPSELNAYFSSENDVERENILNNFMTPKRRDSYLENKYPQNKQIGGLKKPQQDLKNWENQKWRTNSGEKSSETGERYLPDEAWDNLSASEKARTNRAKREGGGTGKNVPQPKDIAEKTSKFRKAQYGLDDEIYYKSGGSTVNSAGNYTKPEMRKRLFNKIKGEASMGTEAGQWSARKAQKLAKTYKENGGGYKQIGGKLSKYL